MKNINISRIYYKPIIEFETVDILGLKYPQRIESANLYVVDTDDIIEEGSSVSFKHGGIFYTLEDVSVVKSEGMTFIECREFIEELF